jgi:hypothetical protein
MSLSEDYDSEKAKEWILSKTDYYKQSPLHSDDLWESASESIQEQIDQNLLYLADPALKDVLYDFRQVLRQKGVAIQKRRGLKLGTAIEDWLAKEYPEWSDDDLLSLMKDVGKDQLPYCLRYEIDERNLRNTDKYQEIEPPNAADEDRETEIPPKEPSRTDTTPTTTSNSNTDTASIPIDNTKALIVVNDADEVTTAVIPTLLPQQYNVISKMIDGDMKYSGTNDALDHKINAFKDICETVNLPRSDYRKAMRLMLKGPALDHFFEHTNVITFNGMIASIREAFEGPDFKRSQLAKWNTLTYQKIRIENPAKSAPQCIDLLVNGLYAIRRNLDDAFKSETVLYARIIDACTGAKECHVAISNPSEKLPMLINNLKSSVTTYIATYGDPLVGSGSTLITEGTTDAHLVDRRYNRNQFGGNRNQFGGNNRFSRPFGRLKTPFPSNSRNNRNCYVCHRPDCWSTKHTQEERDNSRKQLINRARQYMTEMFDEEDDHEQESEDVDQYIKNTLQNFNLDDPVNFDAID